jgi:hypothetical protein
VFVDYDTQNVCNPVSAAEAEAKNQLKLKEQQQVRQLITSPASLAAAETAKSDPMALRRSKVAEQRRRESMELIEGKGFSFKAIELPAGKKPTSPNVLRGALRDTASDLTLVRGGPKGMTFRTAPQ